MEPQKKTILIVDDEEIVLELLSSFLKKYGFNTMLASGGREALDAVKNKVPDLILMDIKMPGMDGYELSRILKENEPTRFVGIIVVTGYDSRENKEKSFECGADDVVGKPLDLDGLIFRIRTWFELEKTQSEIERLVKYGYMVNKYSEGEMSK